MRLNHPTSIPPSLFAMSTQAAEIQIVASPRGLVIDLQATNVDTEGHARACHAITRLALDEAMRLQTLLDQAVDAAWDIDDPVTERTDPRQSALPAIWSDSVTIQQRHRRAA